MRPRRLLRKQGALGALLLLPSFILGPKNKIKNTVSIDLDSNSQMTFRNCQQHILGFVTCGLSGKFVQIQIQSPICSLSYFIQ